MKKWKVKIFWVFIILVIVWIGVMILGQKWISNLSNYKIITEMDEINKIYSGNDPRMLFVDLRDEADYEKGHIDKFINIPFTKEDKNTLLTFLDKNKYKRKTIILMCYSSKRASNAFNYLLNNGYKNIYVINISSEELLNNFGKDIETGSCNCLE